MKIVARIFGRRDIVTERWWITMISIIYIWCDCWIASEFVFCSILSTSRPSFYHIIDARLFLRMNSLPKLKWIHNQVATAYWWRRYRKISKCEYKCCVWKCASAARIRWIFMQFVDNSRRRPRMQMSDLKIRIKLCFSGMWWHAGMDQVQQSNHSLPLRHFYFNYALNVTISLIAKWSAFTVCSRLHGIYIVRN